jgi:hypothetical protein
VGESVQRLQVRQSSVAQVPLSGPAALQSPFKGPGNAATPQSGSCATCFCFPKIRAAELRNPPPRRALPWCIPFFSPIHPTKRNVRATRW